MAAVPAAVFPSSTAPSATTSFAGGIEHSLPERATCGRPEIASSAVGAVLAVLVALFSEPARSNITAAGGLAVGSRGASAVARAGLRSTWIQITGRSCVGRGALAGSGHRREGTPEVSRCAFPMGAAPRRGADVSLTVAARVPWKTLALLEPTVTVTVGAAITTELWTAGGCNFVTLSAGHFRHVRVLRAGPTAEHSVLGFTLLGVHAVDEQPIMLRARLPATLAPLDFELDKLLAEAMSHDRIAELDHPVRRDSAAVQRQLVREGVIEHHGQAVSLAEAIPRLVKWHDSAAHHPTLLPDLDSDWGAAIPAPDVEAPHGLLTEDPNTSLPPSRPIRPCGLAAHDSGSRFACGSAIDAQQVLVFRVNEGLVALGEGPAGPLGGVRRGERKDAQYSG